MSAVCLIDTSILLEILNVPNKASNFEVISNELLDKNNNGELLFLPMATILETGNHIAQNGDGRQRRACALEFVDLVDRALREEPPFIPIHFLDQDQLKRWLNDFPDSATNEVTLGDMSIIHDWERLCMQNKGRTVYIWSLDAHLSSHNRSPVI